MSDNREFEIVFNKLKSLLIPYQQQLDCYNNDAQNYSLNTHHIMKNKKPLFFGAVQINKNYVSFHLMPVYVNPQLLTNISTELKARMQGKSCFNFKVEAPQLFAELAQLVKLGFEDYKLQGFVC